MNAFALPSKDVFVYTGLMELVDDDGMLAAIMAHEIAHVTQRHAVENVSCIESWTDLSLAYVDARTRY